MPCFRFIANGIKHFTQVLLNFTKWLPILDREHYASYLCRKILCTAWLTHSSFLDIFPDVCFGLRDGWKAHGRNLIQGSRCCAHWCRRHFIAAKETYRMHEGGIASAVFKGYVYHQQLKQPNRRKTAKSDCWCSGPNVCIGHFMEEAVLRTSGRVVPWTECLLL